MPLGGARVCPHCMCDIDALKAYQGVLPRFTILHQRYMIGRVLGKGGFGVTYVALDLQNNSLCAIKEYMPAEYSSRATDRLTIMPKDGDRAQYIYRHGKEMFYKEAQNLQELRNNPTVVNILAYFNEHNTSYLVMEYLDQDLRTMARKNGGTLDPNYAMVVLVSVASGLMDVHRHGLLHRDISPENIMVAKDGRIVLIDFGAARNYVTQQNKGMSVLLKPGFAPIEQYSSQGKQGTWSDVYALCATFYTLVSGKKPLEASFLQNGAKMPSLAELGCGVSKRTSDAIEYGMQFDYQKRCPDFKTLLDLIDFPSNNPKPRVPDYVPVPQTNQTPSWQEEPVKKNKKRWWHKSDSEEFRQEQDRAAAQPEYQSRQNPMPNQGAQVNPTPAWGQQANPMPNRSVQVYSAPAWGQQVNPTPNRSAQEAQTPAWGQQANPTPNRSAQEAQTPAWGQQANPTPNRSAQEAQTPAWGQQVSQTPNRNVQANSVPAWGQQKLTPSQWNQSPDQAEPWMKNRDWNSAQASVPQEGVLRQSSSTERYGVITLLGVPGHPSKRLYSGQSVSVGRSPERCELVDSGDTYISKEHCKITLNLENGCFYVTDLSANGTFSETGAQLRRQEATKVPLNTTIYLATEKHKVSLSISG